MRELNLSGNNIGDEGVQLVISALSNNKKKNSLTVLSLSKFTIRQDTNIFMSWNILIMINGFYSAISYPYYMTTDFPSINSSGWIVIFLSESLFLLDITLCFFK